MLINLNLFYIILFFVCSIQFNFADEFLNYHPLKPQTISNAQFYPYRFYTSFLRPNVQYGSNVQYEDEYNAAAQIDNNPIEYSKPVYEPYNSNQYEYSNQINGLDQLNKFDHRNGRYKDPLSIESSNKEPHEKEVIEISTLDDDEPTYTELNIFKNDENGLIKYKETPNFEYSTNLIDGNFFRKTRMMADGEFSYDDQENWVGQCTNMNAKQSPIFLSPRESVVDLRSKLDIGIRYAQDIPMVQLENKGHTVQFNIPKKAGDLVITGPALDFEVYKATAIHFHWGENNTVGSEHVINSVRFPLEMHIVHFNAKYENIEEALKHRDGTAVLGIMFKIGKANEAIDPLIRKLNKVRCKGQKSNVKNVNLLRLLPAKVRRLYQYYGSLTTPPCTPTVNWIVIETPNTISSEQLSKFRHLTRDEFCQTPLIRNYRDLQGIKNRSIKRSVKI